ncbi:MAG: DUF853 family protein [Myxococcales bacterium]|nr:DUF853 family protein [Myxococcales bacterium]
MKLSLGRSLPLSGEGEHSAYTIAARDLVTHAVVTGMTGSGKTGLLFVLAEEALAKGVPVLMVDVKGDMSNLLLCFDPARPEVFVPWLDHQSLEAEGVSPVAALCEARDKGLARAGITADTIARFRAHTFVRVLTPGSSAGEPVHLLSSLEQRSPLWDGTPSDVETARDALASAVSLVLRLLGRDGDPARSREHVLLCVLAERRLQAKLPADLPSLMHDLETPPVDTVGAMPIDRFVSKKDRRALAAALNALVASPSFASWRTGAPMDIAQWLRPVANETAPRQGIENTPTQPTHKTPAVIVSVAHLDETERTLVLGLLFDALLAYVRSLPGTSSLRALVVLDELYGMLPPHPANPPTRRPLVALVKQARAFGVGLVLATQNPMDLDYRALSNAGLWFIGRLQTDADRDRVVDGLAEADAASSDRSARRTIDQCVKRLGKRWFLVRNVHQRDKGAMVLQPRQTLSWLRGPLTRDELRRVNDTEGA